LTPADAQHFREDRSGHKFYDPNYKSCTKLLADIGSSKFGFDVKPLAELVHWGDIIDGAQFVTPESAVALKEPAMQLALVIEAAPESNLVPRLIPEMAQRSLAEMVEVAPTWRVTWDLYWSVTGAPWIFCGTGPKRGTASFILT